MKYCYACGAQMDDAHQFCQHCGTAAHAETLPAPVPAPADDPAAEKKCLDNFFRFLKYERLAWKIDAIVFLITSILFVAFGGLFIVVGMVAGMDDTALGILFSTYGWTYALLGCTMFLPISIVGFVMLKKIDGYMSTLYRDVQPTVDRCGSVGMIVFGGLFSTVATVFIIINFVRTKTEKATIKQIVARQAAFRAQL